MWGAARSTWRFQTTIARIMSFNLATAPVGKNVYQVAQNVYLKMYAKTRPGTGTQRMSMSPGMLGERYLMNQCLLV